MSFERFSIDQVPVDTARRAPPPVEAGDRRIAQVREAIDRMEQSRRHHRIPKAQWYVLLKDLRGFTDHWLDIALGCGWNLLDLYGSPIPVNGRIGLMGVVLLLRGRAIESIDQDRIVITNRAGPPNVWRREVNGTGAPHRMRGAVLIWDAVQGGEI